MNNNQKSVYRNIFRLCCQVYDIAPQHAKVIGLKGAGISTEEAIKITGKTRNSVNESMRIARTAFSAPDQCSLYLQIGIKLDL